VDVAESGELLDRARDVVRSALDGNGTEHLPEWSVVSTTVKDALAKFLYSETRRRPMVLPMVIEV
jgi:ribonuclease J